jgi:hypothetical protein
VDEESGVLEPAALEGGELGQGDGVVRDRSCRQSLGLVVQAKLLQVLEGGGESAAVPAVPWSARVGSLWP